MKTAIFTLMIALMSVMTSTPCSAKTAIERETCMTEKELPSACGLTETNQDNVNKQVPSNLIVKQTTLFKDGRTLVVYYKKQGSRCEVYSPCNANDYNMNDVSKVKSTNFEVVDKVEGKLYKKSTIDEVTRFFKQMLKQ